MRSVPNRARPMNRLGVWAVVVLAVLLAIGGVVGILMPSYQDYQRRAQEAVAAKEAEAEESQRGQLTIWVPAGAVGDIYWIYLNGQIVSAPPRRSIQLLAHNQNTLMGDGQRKTVATDAGFLVFQDGDLVGLRNYIDRYIKPFLDPSSADTNHIFYPTTFGIKPGKYTVEVAYLMKDSYSSFPFAITRKYIDYVMINETTQMYVGVPNDWSWNPRAPEAHDSCSMFMGDIERFPSDPVVRALRALSVSASPGVEGVVVIKLPAAQGGAREFDGTQIKYMANAVLRSYSDVRNRATIARCKQSFPDLSQSLDEYAKLVGDFESHLQFVHTLAGK